MTSKKNFKKKMKRYHKNHEDHKEMSPRAKKAAAGAASALLGVGIMTGANTHVVKAAGYREDEIAEVESANVLSSEKTKVRISVQQRTNSTEDQNGEVISDESTETSNDVVTDTSTETASTNPESVATNDTTVDTTSTEGTSQLETQSTETTTEQVSATGDTSNEKTPKEETKTPTYDDAKNEVENINNTNNSKLDEAIENAKGEGVEVDVANGEDITTNVSGIKDAEGKLEEHIQKQLDKINKALEQYRTELEKYTKESAEYNNKLAEYNQKKADYIKELKKYGLWDENDVDIDKVSQDLILDPNESSKVTVVYKGDNVTVGTGNKTIGTNPNTQVVLDQFYKINKETLGEFLRLEYTGFQNSKYGNVDIGKILVSFSGWKPNYERDKYDPSGIYFNNKLTDGFWYVHSDGVTVDITLYDKKDNPIDLKDGTAYITAGSLNSEGTGSKYIEKAEIINDKEHNEYGGSGLALPESTVKVHEGAGIYGGDVLYSEKNNEVLVIYGDVNDKTIRKQTQAAINAWGDTETNRAIINKYINWDNSNDNKKAIFGAGLFKVHGKKIKIRFSTDTGSAWATYSTSIPKMTLDAVHPGKAPERPTLKIEVEKKQILLNKNSSVHIHYVDVYNDIQNGVTSGFDHVSLGHGTELGEHVQHIEYLAIGDKYQNTLWDWASAGYVLAEMYVPEALKGTIKDDPQHHYVYLTHNTETEHRHKDVNQVIHYIYEDGTTAHEDYNGKTLHFVQTGTKDLVTGEITWDEWTPVQSFEMVKSPEIENYVPDRLEVGPYNIIVTNDNYGNNLDKEDTVVYKAQIKETSRDKVVTQVIHYVYEDGSTAKPDHVSVNLVFTQTGVKNMVTGEEIWDGEWTPVQSFEMVKSPEIENYVPDHLEVGPYNIIVTNDNYGNNLDKEDTVVYKAQIKETSRDKVVTQVIHYVYEDGSTAKPDHVSVNLVFTQTGVKNMVTGEEIWDGEWTPVQSFEMVKSPEIENYVPDRLEVGPYNIIVTNDNYGNNLDKEDTVVYKAQIKETSRDKVVTQVIHYVYEDGSTAKPDHVSVNLVFTQTGVKNMVTGEEIWDGEWTKTQTFVTVVSPVIEGYTADRLEVGPYDITVTNDNYGNNLDKEDTVVYRPNTTTPDLDPDPTPAPDPTPTPDPEPEPTPGPLPEEEPDKENKGTGTAKVAPVKAATVSDEAQTPETVSTTEGISDESTEVAEKSQNEETLPETGDKKAEAAGVLGALAATMGITGLDASRRRKASAKVNRKDKKNGK